MATATATSRATAKLTILRERVQRAIFYGCAVTCFGPVMGFTLRQHRPERPPIICTRSSSVGHIIIGSWFLHGGVAFPESELLADFQHNGDESPSCSSGTKQEMRKSTWSMICPSRLLLERWLSRNRDCSHRRPMDDVLYNSGECYERKFSGQSGKEAW